jgi:hypothetical protein
MTLAEAAEIFRYWEQNPPTHLMLQTIGRLLGWAPPARINGTPQIEGLMAAPPPGLVVTRGDELDMPAPLLDSDALRARNLALAVTLARQNRCGGD